jgi:hypothetical protein
MGAMMETNDDLLRVEDRRESIIFSEKKEYGEKAKHIFNYDGGMVEISKAFLKRMLLYFKSHPDVVEDWNVPHRIGCPHCGLSMNKHDDPEFCPPGTEEGGGRR